MNTATCIVSSRFFFISKINMSLVIIYVLYYDVVIFYPIHFTLKYSNSNILLFYILLYYYNVIWYNHNIHFIAISSINGYRNVKMKSDVGYGHLKFVKCVVVDVVTFATG